MTARRERDALAPSLFPFLAVLLCTMGSLVLILMLIVSGAQAAANKVVTEQRHRREELEAHVENATIAFYRELEDGRVDLEKQRLVLEHYEEHILELMEELKELDRANQLLNEEENEFDLAEVEQQISELEEQLLEATKELEQEVDKPEGDKPVFAIVPYQGPNGTHRRPIYLECDADGVRIQPEGNLLTIEDLRPPHGPGNPLDAALRAIRAEYKPANGAVTDTAYPLLVVRPSGIRAYALARSALGSWDEQFGYELIDEELDLVFPDGVPGLQEKVATAIDLAKQRQAALVMAMPNRFQRDWQQPLSGGGNSGGSPAQGTYSSGGARPGPNEFASPPSGGSREGLGSPSQSGRTNSFGTGNAPQFTGNPNASGAPNGNASWPDYYAENASQTGLRESGNSSLADRGSSRQPGALSYGQGSPGVSPDGTQPSGAETAGSRYFGSDSTQGGRGQSSNDAWTGDQSGTGTQEFAGGQSASGGSQTGTSSGADSSQGTSMAQSSGGQGGQSGAAPSSGGSLNSNPGGASQSQDDPSNPPSPPQIGLNVDLSRRENSQPVSRTQGSGWAWSPRSQSRTAVVRTIQLQCLADRWVLLPDRGTNQRPVTIPFDGTPQLRAEKLARTIRDRVDDWGLALAGGYWKPEIAVDVAPEVDWRFDQLRQLMDGSGIAIRKRAQTARQPATSGGNRR